MVAKTQVIVYLASASNLIRRSGARLTGFELRIKKTRSA
jgi:hypothetical protein